MRFGNTKTEMDVGRWKEEELWKGLSWTDPFLMKSPRGKDKGMVPSLQCMLTHNTNTLYGVHQKTICFIDASSSVK